MYVVDTSTWKPFRVGELFEVVPTKGVNTYGIEDDGDTPYIAASRENNGCSRFVSCDSNWVSPGNCLVFIHIGDAAAGVCHYVDKDFVGMKGKTSCAYNEHINKYIGLFLASVITANNASKYSFSESWTGKGLLETEIMLPATPDGDPDWAYMESYMRGVMDREEVFASHLASLTAEAVADGHVIDTSAWKAFRAGELFETYTVGKKTHVPTGGAIAQKLLSDGSTPRITVSGMDNGVVGYFDDVDTPNYRTYENFISVSFLGTVFYQEQRTSVDMKVHVLIRDDLNIARGLFLVSAIRAALADCSYADQITSAALPELRLMLPATPDGDPDWAFMETYMKSVMEREAMFADELDRLIV